jgi:hypothetical protein
LSTILEDVADVLLDGIFVDVEPDTYVCGESAAEIERMVSV